MGSAQRYGFLAANFLILTLLADSTTACYCKDRNVPLQTQYCVSDVVLKGKFVNAVWGDPEWFWVRYDFEPSQTFKAPYTPTNTHWLYSQILGDTCGYKHDGSFTDDEYLIAGHKKYGRVTIDICSFIKKWDHLSPEELQGLQMGYPDNLNECLNFKAS